MSKNLLIYLPVVQKGYVALVEKYQKLNIYVLNQDLINLIDDEFDYLRKEIRALETDQALKAIQALFPNSNIKEISPDEIKKMNNPENEFILPKEDILVWLAEKHLKQAKTSFEDIFLRWNKDNFEEKSPITGAKSNQGKFLEKIINLAETQKNLSSDWWRQVGAVIFKDNKVIVFSHNHHLPSPYTPYIDSDPRNCSKKGQNIQLSTAIHAEAALISKAAKKGISLEGSSIYVTTFPCPTCAKLIACSGINKVYFSEGYSMTDGEKTMTDAGIEIIKVD